MLLKIAYISLTLLMVIVLILIGAKAIHRSNTDKKLIARKKGILILALILWQVYVIAISYSGSLANFDFPPRFFLLLILPLFIFTGVFIYLNRNNAWITSIPEHRLIYYQSFRILIESIFVMSVAQGILNQEVTLKGYNYDMLFAFTAPVFGFLAYKKWISRNFLILWNYAGLLIIASIIFLFMSSIYNPQLFGSEIMILPESAVKYPYTLVAGFLMPSAVFTHVLSIVQLTKNKSRLPT